jgi:uncharacterized membrane protein YhhN
MMKRHKWFSAIFALIFILQLTLGNNGIGHLEYFIKPSIVISLLIVFFLTTKLKGRFHKRIFIGLIFALAGDVLLIYAAQDPTYFMYGLIAFLLCHVFYISAFYLDFRSAQELDKKGARIAILLCAILVIGYYLFLRSHLGTMKLPVMIYILVISMMMMMASFRNQRVNTISFKLILFGAMLFMLSDSILAYNKFVQPVNHSGLWIMSTYMIAQYLITIGAIERKLLHNN